MIARLLLWNLFDSKTTLVLSAESAFLKLLTRGLPDLPPPMPGERKTEAASAPAGPMPTPANGGR